MKKMLVSDYDKTFYIDDVDIEKNKIMIDKFMKRGNIFVISTGRSYLDFYNVVKKYQIKYDYVVLNHGTTILDKNDNLLLNISIANDIIEDIRCDLELNKSSKFFCCSGIDSRVDFSYKDITKINVLYDSEKMAMDKIKVIKNKYYKYVNAYYVSLNTIEIISNNTNKAISLDKIIKIENIDKENVYTVGDGNSDIEMIKEFNGYCMANAISELKIWAIDSVDSVSTLVNYLME